MVLALMRVYGESEIILAPIDRLITGTVFTVSYSTVYSTIVKSIRMIEMASARHVLQGDGFCDTRLNINSTEVTI